jgi:hypothetical protein
MDTTTCPECGELAEVEWRDVAESTDGPVEHAKITCVQRHWFLLPVGLLPRAATEAQAADGPPQRYSGFSKPNRAPASHAERWLP